jgi:WD40 repeat protein
MPERVRHCQMLEGSLAWLRYWDKPPELFDCKSGTAVPTPADENLRKKTLLHVAGRRWFLFWDSDTRQVEVFELAGVEWRKTGQVPIPPNETPESAIYDSTRRVVAWSGGTNSPGPATVHVAGIDSPGQSAQFVGETSGPRPVERLELSRDGRFLLGATYSVRMKREIWAWDLQTGAVVANLAGTRDSGFVRGGAGLVASINHDKKETHEIVFIDLEEPGSEPVRLSGRQLNSSLAVSPDGAMVAAPSRSGIVSLYDSRSATLVRRCHRHMNSAFVCAFSDDGKRLLSAGTGADAIKVWDTETGQELLTLSLLGKGSVLHDVQWSGDGDHIVTGEQNGRGWNIWSAPSWEEIDASEAGQTTAAP